MGDSHYTTLKEKLAENGLKATHQRLMILEELMRKTDHPTAEILYNNLKENNPTLSLATVYKALEAFTSAGLVRKVKTGEESIRYDANLEAHNHLYCVKTRKLIDYKDRDLEQLLESYFMKKGIGNFRVNDIQLQVNGEIVDARKNVNIDKS